MIILKFPLTEKTIPIRNITENIVFFNAQIWVTNLAPKLQDYREKYCNARDPWKAVILTIFKNPAY